MSGERTRPALIGWDGAPTPRGRQVLDTALLPLSAAAVAMDVAPQSLRVYRSLLRRAGFAVPSMMPFADGDEILRVHVAGALAGELREQARLRFPPCRQESAATMLGMIAAIIHKDDLYDAILGEIKGRDARAGRS